MSAFSRAKAKNNSTTKSNANDNSSTSEAKAAYKLVEVFGKAFNVNAEGGMTALAALAVAVAGDDLKAPIGPSLERIATAFESIAESLEFIAEAYEAEED